MEEEEGELTGDNGTLCSIGDRGDPYTLGMHCFLLIRMELFTAFAYELIPLTVLLVLTVLAVLLGVVGVGTVAVAGAGSAPPLLITRLPYASLAVLTATGGEMSGVTVTLPSWFLCLFALASDVSMIIC